ncbi:MAG TPA: PilZ domain-containing protein [Planctomycetota bacterium]|nr:PilZ domain-containing protein [Planctomycetota bacterium]
MERRRDYRHLFRYRLSLRCARTKRVIADVTTEDVSASGLSLSAHSPHGLRVGDKCEVQLFARVLGPHTEDTLVMATDAVVIRSDKATAALRFEAPLAY